MSTQRGFFVAIDGPSGIGKKHNHRLASRPADLTEHGFEVLTHDIDAQAPGQVAEALAAAVLTRRETQPDAS